MFDVKINYMEVQNESYFVVQIETSFVEELSPGTRNKATKCRKGTSNQITDNVFLLTFTNIFLITRLRRSI